MGIKVYPLVLQDPGGEDEEQEEDLHTHLHTGNSVEIKHVPLVSAIVHLFL